MTAVVPYGTIDLVSPTETFVFTDIEDSTGRAGRLGDSTWSSLLRRHNEILAEVVLSHGGREVKKTGDGAMLVFEDPVVAVRCVKEVQGRMRATSGCPSCPGCAAARRSATALITSVFRSI